MGERFRRLSEVLTGRIMKKTFLCLIIFILLLSGCKKQSTPKGSFDVDSASPIQGVKIALIDTGISSKAIEKERILQGFNYVTRCADCEDRINHGTAVSSVIVGCESAGVNGIADNAYLIPLVVTDKPDGTPQSVTPDVLAEAIRDSIDVYGADIINISLGIQKDHPALRETIAYADKMGVPVISAVGNDGGDGNAYYPAAYETVLAVGSCDNDGNKSNFSGNGADILAPGEKIMLASRNGVPYAIKGSSFAAGIVSAYAANLIAENENLAPDELYSRLIETARAYGGYLPFD